MKNLTHIWPFFIVSDVKASVSFYVDTLGFEVRHIGQVVVLEPFQTLKHLPQNHYLCARMKRIVAARKLLNVEKGATLQELKSIYRSFMKEWHPDKFQDNPAAKLEAEEKSKSLIEAYHLLVSVSPETHELQKDQYEETINASRLIDFQYKGTTLIVNFADGSSYEYFGLPKSVYNNLVNSITPDRFARRHIYHSYLYRKANKALETADSK